MDVCTQPTPEVVRAIILLLLYFFLFSLFSHKNLLWTLSHCFTFLKVIYTQNVKDQITASRLGSWLCNCKPLATPAISTGLSPQQILVRAGIKQACVWPNKMQSPNMCNGFQISSHSHGTLCPASVPLTPELSMNVTPTAGTNTATANLDTLASPPQY